MPDPSWQRIRTLFEQAVERQPRGRSSFLETACGGNRVLQRAVEDLLAAHDGLEEFLEPPPPDEVRTRVDNERQERLQGTRIGAYRIDRVLASGGMGTVFEATQESPSRTVALKVMNTVIGPDDAVRRFEYESQILARLRHPGIAQIYEAGTHREDDARMAVPYFAMELVEGARTIVDYAREGLGLRQRLALFTRVCDAVQHGHHRGIIHRDLKPANILVDADGVPKVIDFGVARTTERDARSLTLRTASGQILGTLGYMSPEQLAGDPDELDTRCDVYALGVILYELLCDRPPLDCAGKSLPEAARIIAEEEPSRPTSIVPGLPRDLDWIVQRAMEKERERRYPSAAALALDLQRFLADEPVEAGPPSGLYRARKFVRRHRIWVAAGLLVVVALVGGLLATSMMYLRAVRAEGEARGAEERAHVALRAEQEQKEQARVQERVAKRTLDLFVDTLEVPATRIDPREVRVVDVLELAGDSLGEAEGEDPAVAASLHHALGVSFKALGLYERAAPHLAAAVDLRRELLGEFAPETLSSALHRIDLFRAQVRLDEVAAELPGLIERIRAELGENDRQTFIARDLHCAWLASQGRHEEAVAHQRVLLTDAAHVLPSHDADLLRIQARLAQALRDSGELVAAAESYREVLEAREHRFGAAHHATATARAGLANTLFLLGEFDDAERMLLRSYEALRVQLGPEHMYTRDCALSLAVKYAEWTRFDAAEVWLQRCIDDTPEERRGSESLFLAIRSNQFSVALLRGDLAGAKALIGPLLERVEQGLGPEHHLTLEVLRNKAILLTRLEDYEAAENLAREIRARTARRTGDDRLSLLRCDQQLGCILLERGRFAEAEELLRAARDELSARRKLSPAMLDTLVPLARAVRDQGRWDEAELLHRDAVEQWTAARGARHPMTLDAVNSLAILLRQRRKYDAAESLYRQALAGYRETIGEDSPGAIEVMGNLAVLLRRTGRREEGLALQRAALAGSRRIYGDDHAATARHRGRLAVQLHGLGQRKAAEENYRLALAVLRSRLGGDHVETLQVVHNLGDFLRGGQQWEEAEEMLREAYTGREHALGQRHRETLSSARELVYLYYQQKRYDKAEPLVRTAIERSTASLGEHDYDTIFARMRLVAILYDTDRFAEAAELGAANIAALEEHHSSRRPALRMAYRDLGYVLHRLARWEQGEAVCRQASEWEAAARGEEHRIALHYRLLWVECLLGRERLAEAREPLERLIAVAPGVFGDDNLRSHRLHQHLARCYLHLERTDDAIALLTGWHGRLVEALGADHARAQQIREDLATVYRDAGEPEEAARWEKGGERRDG